MGQEMYKNLKDFTGGSKEAIKGYEGHTKRTQEPI